MWGAAFCSVDCSAALRSCFPAREIKGIIGTFPPFLSPFPLFQNRYNRMKGWQFRPPPFTLETSCLRFGHGQLTPTYPPTTSTSNFLRLNAAGLPSSIQVGIGEIGQSYPSHALSFPLIHNNTTLKNFLSVTTGGIFCPLRHHQDASRGDDTQTFPLQRRRTLENPWNRRTHTVPPSHSVVGQRIRVGGGGGWALSPLLLFFGGI